MVGRWTRTRDNYRSEKKYIVHAFRDLFFGIQIVEQGHIVDYTAANDLFYEIMNQEQNDWEYYQNVYYPRYQSLKDQFTTILNRKMMIAPESIPNDCVSYTMSFLSLHDFSLDALNRYLSMNVTQHRSFPSFYHIRDTRESPHASSVVIEAANGMLVEIQDQPKVVSVSIPLVLPYNDHYIPKLNYDNGASTMIRKSENVSIMVTMYKWMDQWKLCSVNTPDAEELLTNSESTISVNELFWKVFGDNSLPYDVTDENVCFTFLLDTGRYVKSDTTDQKDESVLLDVFSTHSREQVGLLAVIDRISMKMLSATEYAVKYGWDMNTSDHCSSVFGDDVVVQSIDEAISYSLSLDPTTSSSVWIIDSNQQRISVPSSQRISLLALLESYPNVLVEGEKHMVDVVRSVFVDKARLAKVAELLSCHYPVLVSLFDITCNKYAAMCKYLDGTFDELARTTEQKIFVDGVNRKFEHLAKKIASVIMIVMMQRRNGKHHTPTCIDSNLEIHDFATFFALTNNDRVTYKIFNSIKV
jgi:hypothetical protein